MRYLFIIGVIVLSLLIFSCGTSEISSKITDRNELNNKISKHSNDSVIKEDFYLTDLIEFALNHNEDLKYIEKMRKSNMANQKQMNINQSLNPQVQIAAGSRIIPNQKMLPVANLAYIHPIEIGSQIEGRKLLADAELGKSNISLTSFKARLIAKIKHKFSVILLLEEKLRLLNEIYTYNIDFVKYIEKSYNANDMSKTDLLKQEYG